MNTPKEYKERFRYILLNRIYDYQTGKYPIWIRQVNDSQFQTRCPYCLDTEKRDDDGHLYIKCDPTDNYPIMYNCFKCGSSGSVNVNFLELMNITDSNICKNLGDIKQKFTKIGLKTFRDSNSFIKFDYKCPPIKRHREKIEYLYHRLEISLTEKQIRESKVITSLKDFIEYNDITEITCSKNVFHILENDYIGFLSYGNSHILFRDITNTHSLSWIKYPITKISHKNRISYFMESEVDLFSNEEIYVNIAEGIMDTISIRYQLPYGNHYNSIHIANGGNSYRFILLFLIGLGFVGDNIIINIFSDNDKAFNKNNKSGNTDIEYYKKHLSPYLKLFKEFNVYYNTTYKDCGVPLSMIKLKRYRL